MGFFAAMETKAVTCTSQTGDADAKRARCGVDEPNSVCKRHRLSSEPLWAPAPDEIVILSCPSTASPALAQPDEDAWRLFEALAARHALLEPGRVERRERPRRAVRVAAPQGSRQQGQEPQPHHGHGLVFC